MRNFRDVPARRRVAAWTLVLAVLVTALPLAAQAATDAERRVALVIGNDDYQTANKLANPVNDARAMAAKLKELGFDVIAVENGSQQIMRRAVGQFSNKLGPDAVSLFFYAGHGMQVNGHNYLIPIDAEISTEQTVQLESIDVDAVINQMAMAKSRINLVILDACRNNPYERRFRGQSGGLASIEAPTGTLIAYATSPGKVAADGDSGNGLYTSELLTAIDAPGAKVEDVFKQVRRRVEERSHNDQTPWEASSLTGDFYFTGPTTVIAAPAPPAPTTQPTTDREVVLWTSVKDSRNPAILQTYLDQFPQGMFAATAKLMIEDLKKTQLAAAPTKPDIAPAPAEAAPTIEDIEGAYITVKRANVRDRPAAEAKLVKALEPGVPLTVTGRVKGTGWYRIASADGKLHGFVFGDAVQDLRAAEETEWQRVKDTRRSAIVVAFLARFPSGVYANQARMLRDQLAKAEMAEQNRPAPQAPQPPPQPDTQRTDAQGQRDDAVRNQMLNMFTNIIGTIPRH
jgi:hypothetical protein